ncbi:MAG: sulfurtransferase-like selenium metabolism protein YedF [Chloroflexota bacterium]|nr:sulfurtransferase-like selenium metabolism protein YedF [Chloroflexota bacterium]
MKRIVDARGLSCPQPVIMTKKVLEEASEVTTIVDNNIARDNVIRLANKEGCDVSVEEEEGSIRLHISRKEQPSKVPSMVAQEGSVIIVVGSDKMGNGSGELGDVLMRSFLHTLGEVEPRPNKMIFFNSGVKLAIDTSPVVDDLRSLEGQGVTVLVCGTCLQYYGIKDRVVVGEVSNMYTIAELLLSAAKTITI